MPENVGAIPCGRPGRSPENVGAIPCGRPGMMNVRHWNARVSIIDIQGDISALAEPALMEAYANASLPMTRAIILNFSELAYMNSSGIGLLVTLLIRAHRQKQQVLAYGLSEHYRHIFQLTRISDAIKSYAGEAEALAAAS